MHGLLGYAVVAVLVVLGLQARGRVRSGRSFESAPYRAGLAVLDLQVLIGLAVALDTRFWEAPGWRPGTHLGLAVAIAVLMHLGIRRARDERWAASAYRIASRTNLGSAVLLVVAAWVVQGT